VSMQGVYGMPRVGLAETAERDSGRADRYTIHEDRGEKLYVSYIGYREGNVLTGLPLGGPRWSPPTYFETEREGFALVRIFAQEPDRP
jgi:hypothetical protein